ncbi:UdgX family uracil-DNA binding protein [Pseudomonas asuensis]|nr:UdgX family uracil-DNA binding protein [Pseudomonas asuensis]
MRTVSFDGSFAGWRCIARQLLEQDVAPSEISWQTEHLVGDLFAGTSEQPETVSSAIRVPKQLAELLSLAACYRHAQRWALLYRVLWRVVRGDQAAMLAGDEDGSELHRWAKAVRRETHHLHAFLRFKHRGEHSGNPQYVAWHEPAHDVLALAAPHFCNRMGNTSWLIATPEAVALWDGKTLAFKAPCPVELQALAKQQRDDGESLWLAYYASTFNPARANPKVMTGHMPKRFWKDLPEGPLIPALLSEARTGTQRTAQAKTVSEQAGKTVPVSAEEVLPVREQLSTLDTCRRCPLWQKATQAVPGEGPLNARLFLVGEQPGDHEDLLGRPFMGPAGQVLDQAIQDAGLQREALYLTNAVKHFKWTPQGRRRKHVTPTTEIAPCRHWLEQELDNVKPDVIVALGATALESLTGKKQGSLAMYMGQATQWKGRRLIVTYHPSYILRVPEEAKREQAQAALTAALVQARQLLEQ